MEREREPKIVSVSKYILTFFYFYLYFYFYQVYFVYTTTSELETRIPLIVYHEGNCSLSQTA